MKYVIYKESDHGGRVYVDSMQGRVRVQYCQSRKRAMIFDDKQFAEIFLKTHQLKVEEHFIVPRNSEKEKNHMSEFSDNLHPNRKPVEALSDIEQPLEFVEV